MSKIKKLKVKTSETEFGTPVSLGADAINIDMANGGNAEDEINSKVTQSFESAGSAETPNKINADTIGGYSASQLYSDFISIEVPISSTEPNADGYYFATVNFDGMTADKAIMGIQMDYETSIVSEKEAAAYSWDYLETGENVITFYGKSIWTSPFGIIGVIIQTKEENNNE